MNFLRVLERYVESITAHEARVEELVKLVTDQRTQYHQRIRMALVCLRVFSVAGVFPQDRQEEDSKQEESEISDIKFNLVIPKVHNQKIIQIQKGRNNNRGIRKAYLEKVLTINQINQPK